MAAPVTMDYISDWTVRLRTRLYAQFRNKVTWEQWVQLLGKQNQDLEDSLQSLFTLFDINNSVGAQLDLIGKLVGQARNGFDDATYRILLRAKILVNHSRGTPEELYDIFRALYGSGLIYQGGIVKQFALRSTTVITPVQMYVGQKFLGQAKEAGARAILEWQEVASTNTFHIGVFTFLVENLTPGMTDCDTMSTNGFGAIGATGSLTFDADTATAETVTYTVESSTGFSFTPALANNHSINGELKMNNPPGKGFTMMTSLKVASSAGATAITSRANDDFPDAGSICIDAGLPTEETVAYTASRPLGFNVSALTYDHVINSEITLVDYGGDFIGAIQAS